jgi:hypothetical protein
MQISTSTLLASQRPSPAQAKPASGFSAALEGEGFSPLPLKQPASSGEAVAASAPKGPVRLGTHIDIKI